MDEQDAMIKNIMGMVGLGIGGAKAGTEIYTGLNNLGDSQRLNAAKVTNLGAETAGTEKQTSLAERVVAARELEAKTQRAQSFNFGGVGQGNLSSFNSSVTPHVSSNAVSSEQAGKDALELLQNPMARPDSKVFGEALDRLGADTALRTSVTPALRKAYPNDPNAGNLPYSLGTINSLAKDPNAFGMMADKLMGGTPGPEQQAVARMLFDAFKRGGSNYETLIGDADKALQPGVPDTAPRPWSPGGLMGMGDRAPNNDFLDLENAKKQRYRDAITRMMRLYGGADSVQLGEYK
jgi:hypothetical protein